MEYKVIPTFPNEMKTRFAADRKYADEDDSYQSFIPPSDIEFVAEDNTKIRKPIIKIPNSRHATLDRRYGSSPPNLHESSPQTIYGSSPPINYSSSPPVIYGSAPKEYQPIYGPSPNECRKPDHYQELRQNNTPMYHDPPQFTNDPVGMAAESEYKFVKRKPVEMLNRGIGSDEFNTSRSNTATSHTQESVGLQAEIKGKPIFVSLFENTRPTELMFACILGFSIGYSFKTFGKILVLIIGFMSLFIQVLTYFEIVTINWEKIEVIAQKHFDIDGDGKLTMYDALFMLGKCFCHFALNVPTSVGFCCSIWFGYNW